MAQEKNMDKLREEAKKLLSSKDIDVLKWGSDVKRLVEELSIYQIELEHQNEALLLSQDEALHAGEKYMDLFDNAPVGYLVVDESFKVITANNTFCRTFLVQKNELVGTTLDKLIMPLFQDTFYHFFRLLQKGEMIAQTEVKMRSPKSREIYSKIDAIRQKDGNIRLTVNDISLIKKLEGRLRTESEKLHKSESKFRQIVEKASSIFYYQDLKTKRIVYISPNVEDILGYSADEIMGMSENDFLLTILPKYRSWYINVSNYLVDAEIEGVPSVNRISEMYTKDGDIRWVKGSYSLVKENDIPVQVIGCLQDITVTRDHEKELIEEKEKAEESDRLKSAFLANMSHEIRTPLNGILGFAGLMKENMSSSNEFSYYAEVIEKCGKRLLDVINDIISISKIESNQLEVKKEVFDICGVLRDAYDLLSFDAKQKGIKLIWNDLNNGSKHIHIETDKEKITSVIYNLIKNAIKYTKVGYVEFGVEDRGSELYFFVKDTGIGISESKRKFIFRRFTQVDETGFNEGVGLGLCISKGIIDLLGGDIGFESEQEKGSTFYFSLPYQKPIRGLRYFSGRSRSANSNLDLNKKHILIAEDDYFAFQLLTEYLSNTGAVVDFAANGTDLMEMLTSEKIDFILLDINMPNRSGESCLKEIRERKLDIKVIVQTAYAQAGDREKFLEMGADAYLAKPIQKSELFGVMRDLIEETV